MTGLDSRKWKIEIGKWRAAKFKRGRTSKRGEGINTEHTEEESTECTEKSGKEGGEREGEAKEGGLERANHKQG